MMNAIQRGMPAAGNPHVRSAVALINALCVWAAFGAENLVVPEGTTRTITGTETYNEIFVNGELTVADGAVVTAARLVVASNMTDSASVARLTLSGSAAMTVTADDQYGLNCFLGYNGRAAITLNDTSVFKTGSGSLCYKPTEKMDDKVVLTLNDRSLFVVTSARFTVTRGSSYTTNAGHVNARIVLNGSSVFKAKIIHRNGYDRGLGISFNGGRLMADSTYGGGFLGSYNNKGFTLLESVNGNPCIIELGSSSVKAIFDGDNSQTGYFKTTGTGPIVICGTYSVPLFTTAALSGATDRHNWNATDLYIKSGTTVSIATDTTLPSTGTVKLPAGAVLDLKGFNMAIGGAFVAGTVTNSASEQATSKLTVVRVVEMSHLRKCRNLVLN